MKKELTLDELFDLLTPKQRDAMVLRYRRGLSYEQIALTLEISKNAVVKRCEGARERMSKAINPRKLYHK